MTRKQRKQMYSIIRKNHIRKIVRTFPRIQNPDFLWYERAKEYAASIHPNVLIGAGVIAALSPQQRWHINAAWARKTCTSWLNGQRVMPNVGTYLVREKAFRILQLENPTIEDITAILRGQKITRFFLNIIGHTSPVTLDSWMLQFLKLPPTPCIEMYERTEKTFQKAAEILGIPPSKLQSALWVYVRGGHE